MNGSKGCAYIYAIPVDDESKMSNYHNAVITAIDGRNVSIQPMHIVKTGSHLIKMVDYIDGSDSSIEKVSKDMVLDVKLDSAYYLAAYFQNNNSNDYWYPVVLKTKDYYCSEG